LIALDVEQLSAEIEVGGKHPDEPHPSKLINVTRWRNERVRGDGGQQELNDSEIGPRPDCSQPCPLLPNSLTGAYLTSACGTKGG